MEAIVKTKYNVGDEVYAPDAENDPIPAVFVIREIHAEFNSFFLNKGYTFFLRYVADPISEEIGKDIRKVFLEHQCFDTAEECEECYCKPTRLLQKGVYLPED